MAKAQIMADGVSQVARENMGLKWVHVHIDPHRRRGANPADGGSGRLAVLVTVTTPASTTENERHKICDLMSVV